MPEKCHVHNCTHPVTARGLCNTHLKRLYRHGDVSATRPADWGKREKHPAYASWCNLRRYHRQDLPASWRDDFWAFVKDAPERPAGRSAAQRVDESKPWGPDNFYWKERRGSTKDHSEYMREWYRKARAANPDYYLAAYLWRKYKVTLEWYREQLSKQNNVCAICKQPEGTVIRGRTIAMPVDHDHNSGKARGLLCTKCNRGLGLFRDDEGVLKAAIDYLREYSA